MLKTASGSGDSEADRPRLECSEASSQRLHPSLGCHPRVPQDEGQRCPRTSLVLSLAVLGISEGGFTGLHLLPEGHTGGGVNTS